MIKYTNLTLAGIIFSTSIIHAQQLPDDLKEYHLPEVVIEASRFLDTLREISVEHIKLGKPELTEQLFINLPYALENAPGVWMQRTNLGSGSPFLRGLTGYQTLLLMDGIRLNNSTFRSGPNQYFNTLSIGNITTVEIVKSGGSVQYGSDAIGGVIQVFSPSPEFEKSGRTLTGHIGTEMITEEMHRGLQGSLTYQDTRWFADVKARVDWFGDIKGGGDISFQRPTAYDQSAQSFKLARSLSPHHQLTGYYSHLKQPKVPLYHKVALENYDYYFFQPQELNMAYLKWSYDHPERHWASHCLTFSYQNSKEGRNYQKPNKLTRELDEVQVLGITGDISLNWGQFGTTRMGTDAYVDVIGSSRAVGETDAALETKRGLYPDGSEHFSASPFLMHRIGINKWSWEGGMRYYANRMNIPEEAFNNPSISSSAMVWDFSAHYLPATGHRISGKINSAFRAPNINDVSSLGQADFRYEIPNYDLKPEKSLNMEIGYSFNCKSTAFSIYLFQNSLTDLITNVRSQFQGQDSIGGAQVYQRQNSAEAILRGGEFQVEVPFSNQLKWGGNLTYTWGKDLSKNEPMRRIPPLFGRTFLRFTPLPGLTIRPEVVLAGKQARLSGGDRDDNRIQKGGTPGWAIAHLFIGWKRKDLHIYLQGINLLNKPYRIHGSGIDGMGRALRVGVMYDFGAIKI